MNSIIIVYYYDLFVDLLSITSLKFDSVDFTVCTTSSVLRPLFLWQE